MADEVNRLKQEGNKFYTNKLYAQAITKYTEGILHEIYQSDNLDNEKLISLRQALLLNRSKCYFQTEDYKNALIDSSNCINTQKGTKLAYKAHFQRAEIYHKLKKYTNAIKHCDEIINSPNIKNIKGMNAWIDRTKKLKNKINKEGNIQTDTANKKQTKKQQKNVSMTMGEHHRIIQTLQNQKSDQSDVAFMISAKWWKKWKKLDPQSKVNDNLNILIIDNSDLIQTSTKNEQKSDQNVIEIDNESAYFQYDLRPNLCENEDYILLQFQSYQKMNKMGYKMKQKLFIKRMDEWNKKSQKMERKYEIYKTRYCVEYKSKKYIVISSKSETIRKIMSHIARYFVITSSSIRIIWNGIILDSSHSLGQHGVNEDDLLFIECQHENGCWPTKNHQLQTKEPPKIVCNACQRLIYHFVECKLAQTDNEKFQIDDDQKYTAKYCNNKHLRSHSTYRKKELLCKFSLQRRNGMTGLINLGNTCYMNSSLQCLSFIPKLRSYLVSDDYTSDINKENALGYNGKLAVCMSMFFKKMWFGLNKIVKPMDVRIAFAQLHNQWASRDQQDAEEFIRWLLDGLHEDLNLIKKKPYYPIPDSNNRSDDIVANEHWTLHLKRNQSVIVDLFQGQYKSTILCPKCDKESVKFDAFSALTLPVPDKDTMIPVKCLVFCEDFSKAPYRLNVNVSAKAVVTQLTNALNEKLNGFLAEDMSLLACKVVDNKFVKYFSPGREITKVVDKKKKSVITYLYQVKSTSIAQRKHDNLILVRMNFCYSSKIAMDSGSSGDSDDTLLQRMNNLKLQNAKAHKIYFAYPMVFDVACNEFTGNNLYNRVKQRLKSMQRQNASSFPAIRMSLRHDFGGNEREWIEIEDNDERIQILTNRDRRVATINVELMQHDYLSCIDAKLALRWTKCTKVSDADPSEQNELCLSDCLKLYTAAEILDCDVWKCSFCKAQPQPSKQLHLWRLPEILIIHLKRFINDGGNGMMNGMGRMYGFMGGGGFGRKNHAMIKIPINGLDLKEYLAESLHADNIPKYDLFATLNHYGQMNFGHYYSCIRTDESTQITNFYESGCEEEEEQIWHLFNDEKVERISIEQLEKLQKDAYLLFYRRRQNV